MGKKFRIGKIVEYKKLRVGFESRERVPRGHRLIPDELLARKQDAFGRGGDECTQRSGTDIRVTCRAAPLAFEGTMRRVT